MRLALYGAPGSGKGVQAELLCREYNLALVSLGNILREEVSKDTDLGKRVNAYMEKGLLIPDGLATQVLEYHLNEERFVLDGFPRNLKQAEALEEMLKKKNLSLDAFIYLEIDEATLLERLSKRRVCRKCQATYHLMNMPPRREGICNFCGDILLQREDDRPEVIKKRLEVFLAESGKVLDFYRQRNKLITIDGRKDKDIVFLKIKLNLNGLCLNH